MIFLEIKDIQRILFEKLWNNRVFYTWKVCKYSIFQCRVLTCILKSISFYIPLNIDYNNKKKTLCDKNRQFVPFQVILVFCYKHFNIFYWLLENSGNLVKKLNTDLVSFNRPLFLLSIYPTNISLNIFLDMFYS